MNKDTHTITQSCIDAIEADALFDQLQKTWDEQSHCIDRALAESDATTLYSSRIHPVIPYRVRVLIDYAILSVVSLASAIYWTILIPSLAYTTPALITCLVIETIYVLLVSECLYWTISLLLYNPACVGTLRMSRFILRSHMRPHYGTWPNGKRRTDLHTRISPSRTSDIFFNHIHFCTRQAVAASIAAVFSLIIVSCTASGDGHTITQNHPDRVSSVRNVTDIIAKI